MIARPCDDHITGCPCINDDPFANLSSEAPDPVDVIRMAWSANNPPINAPENFWGTLIGVGGCSGPDVTTAQDCARRAANHEATDGQPSFGNATTGCTVTCPDGSLFSFFVAPNTFTADTQADADAIAASYCRYRAGQARTCAPAVVTNDASNISGTNARMNGTVNPNGSSTSVFFEWGLDTAYGHLTPVTSVGFGNTTLPFFADVTGLPSGTIHYRIVAISSQGTSRGADKTIITATVTIEVVQDIFALYDLSDDGIVAGIDIMGVGRYWKSGSSTVLDFGGLSGAIECANNGRVGGVSYDAGSNQFGLWDVVGSLPVNAGADIEIKSLNASGVGSVDGAGPNNGIAYRYTNGVGLLDLGNIGTDAYIGGRGIASNSYFKNRTINNTGQIAVTSRNAFPTFKACRWNAGVLTNISPAFCALVDASCSVAINASGNIVGGWMNAAAKRRGFFWNGAAVDFGFPGTNTSVYYLNDANEACGEYAVGPNIHAFRWNITDGAVALPELPGTTDSLAYSLNNDGWIVGYMAAGFVSTAFIYKDGATVSLFSLLTSPGDWSSLEEAWLVNNNKQIAGFGTYLGVPQTCFLMTLP
jgi:hypothetical protein